MWLRQVLSSVALSCGIALLCALGQVDAQCASNPCQNGGTCLDITTPIVGHQCTCTPLYGGTNCAESDCLAATCTYNSPTNVTACQCTDGRQGVSRCECFDAFTTVVEEQRGEITMNQLQIGDKVLSVNPDGAVEFQEIFLFGHRVHNITLDGYLRVTMASGKSATMTSGHLALVGDTFSTMELKEPGDIKVNDVMMIYDEHQRALRSDHVSSITPVTSSGLFNPHTKSGNILAGGIYVSSYTTAMTTTWANILLWFVRAARHVVPSITSYNWMEELVVPNYAIAVHNTA